MQTVQQVIDYLTPLKGDAMLVIIDGDREINLDLNKVFLSDYNPAYEHYTIFSEDADQEFADAEDGF